MLTSSDECREISLEAEDRERESERRFDFDRPLRQTLSAGSGRLALNCCNWIVALQVLMD